MSIQERIEILSAWGKAISNDASLEAVLHRTEVQNRWFTVANSQQALNTIIDNFLDKAALTNWLSQLSEAEPMKQVGLVLAGNIPLVGFHDLLTVLATGNQAQVKLSSKDKYLLPHLNGQLREISPEMAKRVNFTEKLNGFDAIIATGSNNSSRYFKHYFGKVPNIIRKNRTSAAVLKGNESPESLMDLSKDVFSYFGLGCRSVSKLFLPAGYDPASLLAQWEGWGEIVQHNKYKNNYDYNRTLLILNKTPHLASDFLMLVEKEEPLSPVAAVHYEFYKDDKALEERLADLSDQLQCIVGPDHLPFGSAQAPKLTDYADGVDTLKFLQELAV